MTDDQMRQARREPKRHAYLAPSASHRWLNCPASARLEAMVEDTGSAAAEEGTLAHALCARHLKEALGQSVAEEEATIARLSGKWLTGEMVEYAEEYAAEVLRRYEEARAKNRTARLVVEQRMSLDRWAYDCYGTADAVIVADDELEVIDFKYGKGVAVGAEGNTQLMLYALGALDIFGYMYDIRAVRMTIVQPRKGYFGSHVMATGELKGWAYRVLQPGALRAIKGMDPGCPGDWCRFCKVRQQCKALANGALDVLNDGYDPRLLDPAEVAAKIMPAIALVRTWLSGAEEHIHAQAMAGVRYPGYKLVEGVARRRVYDPAGMAAALQVAGYDEAALYKPRELRAITDLEVLTGKKRFAEICSPYIAKTPCAPKLVPADNPKPEWTPGNDLTNVTI